MASISDNPYPSSDEAYAAADKFLAWCGIDTTTDAGQFARRCFAAGWLSGAIRGTDAAMREAVSVATEIIAGIR